MISLLNMDAEVKNYEIGFLVKEESDAPGIVKTISDYKATITNESPTKRIQLAYPIKKETSAYFGSILFLMLPENIVKLNDSLKINPKILRFFITVPFAQAVTETAALPIKITGKMPLTRPVRQMPIIKKIEPVQALSNEALEKKLEEILK